MPLFKTFKAKIHGAAWIRNKDELSANQVLKFSKRKILLDNSQINRGYFDPILIQVIADKMEYNFDKLLNRNDEKLFSIILKNKINQLDDGIYHLDINWWNKIKANIIHNRYWIDKEKEWFVKTLLAAIIGAFVTLMGGYVGYKIGYQSGKESKTDTPTVIHQPIKP